MGEGRKERGTHSPFYVGLSNFLVVKAEIWGSVDREGGAISQT